MEDQHEHKKQATSINRNIVRTETKVGESTHINEVEEHVIDSVISSRKWNASLSVSTTKCLERLVTERATYKSANMKQNGIDECKNSSATFPEPAVQLFTPNAPIEETLQNLLHQKRKACHLFRKIAIPVVPKDLFGGSVEALILKLRGEFGKDILKMWKMLESVQLCNLMDGKPVPKDAAKLTDKLKIIACQVPLWLIPLRTICLHLEQFMDDNLNAAAYLAFCRQKILDFGMRPCGFGISTAHRVYVTHIGQPDLPLPKFSVSGTSLPTQLYPDPLKYFITLLGDVRDKGRRYFDVLAMMALSWKLNNIAISDSPAPLPVVELAPGSHDSVVFSPYGHKNCPGDTLDWEVLELFRGTMYPSVLRFCFNNWGKNFDTRRCRSDVLLKMAVGDFRVWVPLDLLVCAGYTKFEEDYKKIVTQQLKHYWVRNFNAKFCFKYAAIVVKKS